ncbi:MAG: transglutaminase-like domain-containing protein [Woeseiaceae bacterium]|nr:transglutaminase-like domain-containing protein [Woeseiaceae bacterium]
MKRCLLVLASTLFAANAAANELFMATIPVEASTSLSSIADGDLTARLWTTHASGIQDIVSGFDGIEVIVTTPEAITLRFTQSPSRIEPPSDQHSLPSFVIDSEAESVSAIAVSLGNAPTVDELTDFVFEHIDNKTYSRGFDLAAQVAESGEGDCTEHAVLLAALARHYEYPARVTLGVVLIENRRDVLAYGHAWTEIFVDGVWQVADATRLSDDRSVRGVRYIPLGGLDNEGLGYAMSLLEHAARFPARISDIDNADE